MSKQTIQKIIPTITIKHTLAHICIYKTHSAVMTNQKFHGDGNTSKNKTTSHNEDNLRVGQKEICGKSAEIFL